MKSMEYFNEHNDISRCDACHKYIKYAYINYTI